VIERVDTAIISDESMKTNQFLGSNMQVANLVVHATAKFGMEFVGVLDQTNTFGRRSLQSQATQLKSGMGV
jgi:tellurite resistance protein